MGYAAIILAWVLFGGLHSLTASPSIKQWATQRLPIAPGYYRLLYNGLALLTFGPVLLALRAAPTHYLSPWQGSIGVGLSVLVAGGVLGWLALREYNLAEFIGWPPGEPVTHPDSLRKQGLLKYVRHPLYLALLVILIGMLIAWPDWKHLLFGLAALAYIRIGIHFEEQKLIRQFGDEYRRYRQKTPMLLPFLH